MSEEKEVQEALQAPCYAILKSLDTSVVVKVGGQVYQIDKASFDNLAPMLTSENAPIILSTFAAAKASTAKVYDPEKAVKEEKAAREARAIEEFNTRLASHISSPLVLELGRACDLAKRTLTQAEEAPMSNLNLSDMTERTANLLVTDIACYYIKSVTRGNHKYNVIEVLPSTSQFPLFQAQDNEREAMAAFQIAVQAEVISLVPPTLKENLLTTSFAFDNGKVIYTANVKTVRATGNSNGATRGPWLYEDKSGKFPGYEGKVFKTVKAFCLEVGLSKATDAYPHAPGKPFRDNDSLTKTGLAVDFS